MNNNISIFEQKLRLCLGKLNKEVDMDWKEIVDVLGLNCHPDHLRKLSYAYKEFMDYNNEKKYVDNEKIKCLIMNDLHIPYQREDVLEQIRMYKNVDYIILAGDIIDCESCSSFDSLHRPSVEEELVEAHKFICKINEIIDPVRTKIICIKGNHEFRFTKDIMKMQQKHLQKMINPNLLEMLQDGFVYYNGGKKIKLKAIDNFEYVDDWKIKLFDNLIVCHPRDFSGVDGAMLTKVSEHFLNRGMAEKGDVIVFGHTHKHTRGFVNRRQGLYVIENYCMCKPHSYSDTGKLGYNPQNYGYTYLEFNKGEKINLNDIKCVCLE